MANRTDAANTKTNTTVPLAKATAKPLVVTVTAGGNAVQVSSDMALWDTVANAYVRPENTNYGG